MRMSRKGIKNLSFTQRLQIETLNNAKMSVKEISQNLGLHISTIYRELKRGEYEHKVKKSTFWYKDKIKIEKRYSATIAEEKYRMACSARGRPLKIGNDYEFVRYIENRVQNEKISACAILGQIKHLNLQFRTSISKPTLYRYIELGIFNDIKIEKRKVRYRKIYAKRAPKGISIEKRPEDVKQRNTFGHWEMDCVCGNTKPVLLVLSERLTRKEIIFKMENQKADSVVRCLNILERCYGKMFRKVFKTITVDNGAEFSNYHGMERSSNGHGQRTKIFYCHPYCSSERGTNERLNREIRRLVPKGSNLSKLSIDDVQKVEDWMNNYPRSVLNYATANELFKKEMSCLV